MAEADKEPGKAIGRPGRRESDLEPKVGFT